MITLRIFRAYLAASEMTLKNGEQLMLLCALMFNRLPYRTGERRYLAVFAADITSESSCF